MTLDLPNEMTPVIGNPTTSDPGEVTGPDGRRPALENEAGREEVIVRGQTQNDVIALYVDLVVDGRGTETGTGSGFSSTAPRFGVRRRKEVT